MKKHNLEQLNLNKVKDLESLKALEECYPLKNHIESNIELKREAFNPFEKFDKNKKKNFIYSSKLEGINLPS